MKCASCGNEFGNGANCQYCGVDRVTGLGNYSGYSPAKNIPQSATYTESHGNTYQEPSHVEDKNIICYNCGEIIPKDAKFCPYCSTNLYVTCPKCGKEYSSQFPACSECGTNRDEYYRKQRENEERERLYKKWEEIIEKDPSGKEYEKIKDDNNVSWLERYVAEQVVKRKRIYEKWKKVFEQNSKFKENERIIHSGEIPYDERDGAWKAFWDVKEKESDNFYKKWERILEQGTKEKEYEELRNDPNASDCEKEAAKKAISNKKTNESLEKYRLNDKWFTIYNSGCHNGISQDSETVIDFLVMGIAILSSIIAFLIAFSFEAKNLFDRIQNVVFAVIGAFTIVYLLYATIWGVSSFLLGVYNRIKGNYNIKRYIKEHPNDTDIEYLRKRNKKVIPE
jgi:hypothetical protein